MGKILKIKNVLQKREQKIETNRVYQGDNLQIMKEMQGGKIDLIYIDPPFCAQNVFKSKAWGKKTVSFNDEWGGGVQSYIKWLVPRLRECHRLLSDTGSFFIHIDWRTSHYVKVELDKIFGENNFKNDITWKKNSSKGARSVAKHFGRQTESILFYVKDNKQNKFFNDFKPIDLNSKNNKFKFKDKNGRIYSRDCPLGDYSKESIKKFEKQGRIYVTKNGKKQLIRYLDEVKGKPVSDLWDDISPINQVAKERIGYPTQKPLALLDRIIKSTTNKNDLVFDAFCGCGTTVSSAQNLGRKWLGIDISKDAISVIKKRMLKEHKLKIEVINANDLTAKQILNLNPFEFEKKMVELLGGTPNIKQVADGGVDGRAYDFTPIQVKKSYAVGRPVLDSFYKHIRNGNGKGIIVAHSFCKTMREEVSRLSNEEGLEVALIETRDILRDMVEDKKAVENKQVA